MCATRCTFWSMIFLNAHGDVAWHTVEEAAIFDEEVQEETNKGDEESEPSSKHTKRWKLKGVVRC